MLLIVNALAPLAIQDIAQRGFGVSALNLFSIGIVFPIAAYAIWAIARSAPAEPVRRLDWLVAGLALIAILLPLHLASKAALLPLSAYLVASSTTDNANYRIGFIGLSLSGAFIIGALILTVFAGPILALDAMLVTLATGAPVEGNIVSIDRAASGVEFEQIIILGGCSSLRNISQAVILWASLVQLCGLRVTPRLVVACLLTMASMVVINVARIALIVAYPQHLEYIHYGVGSTLFGLASLVASFAIIGLAIVNDLRRLET